MQFGFEHSAVAVTTCSLECMKPGDLHCTALLCMQGDDLHSCVIVTAGSIGNAIDV